MSIYKPMSYLGKFLGCGLGLYAAYENFNPDKHQSEDLSEATKFFFELFQQLATIAIQTTACGLICKALGGIIDLLARGKTLTEHERKHIVTFFKENKELLRYVYNAATNKGTHNNTTAETFEVKMEA